MAITKVSVFLQDSQTGVQTVNDGVAMLFSPGAAIAAEGDGEGLGFNVPVLLGSVDDALGLGIDAAYDAANGVGLYFNIREFYGKAGSGAKLWVCVYDASVSATVTAFLQGAAFKGAVRATKAGLFDNRPRLVGVVQKTGGVVPEDGLSADVMGAVPAFQAALGDLFNESVRMVGILDSGRFSSVDDLPDCRVFNSRSVALAITTTTPGMTASVGLALGMYASVGLSASAGEVALGAVAQAGYFMDSGGTSVKSVAPVVFDDLGAKQFLFLRERPQEAGVFFNDDATCNDPTMALSQVPYLRVGNSVCDLVEWYVGRLIKGRVPVTAAGSIQGTWKTNLLNDLDAKYLTPRINRGDASVIGVDIQAVGNFVESKRLKIRVSIVPNASLEQADVYVFYVSSLTS